LFPYQIKIIGPWLLALAICSIVFAPLAAWAQRDLKRMVAYLSINHLGYCMLALFAVAASPAVSAEIDTHAALSGVFMQIFNHGITAAALFYFVGLLEQRRGLRGIDDFGGLMQRTPLLCGWMSVAMFSSLGLPGLNGFVGEFLIFKGSFATAAFFTAIAVLGLLFTAVTFMRAMQALFSGPLAESCGGFSDLVRGEKFVIVPVTLIMFAIGISPQFIFNIFNATVVQMARLFARNVMIAWTIYITFAGAIVLLVLPRVFARWIALVTVAAGFAVSLATFFCDDVDLAHFTTIVRIPWIPALGMNYHLALDGISLTLVLVTGIAALSAVLFSWDVIDRANEFFFWLLLVVGGSYGVFLSADLFLLFLFYELVIVPKYFLIAIFGSTNKE